MRVEVIGTAGELAAHPEEALSALAKIAEADGASSDWLEKAVAHAGATARTVSVRRDPAFQVVDDVVERSTKVYEAAMKLCREAVRERLEQAVREADLGAYQKLVR